MSCIRPFVFVIVLSIGALNFSVLAKDVEVLSVFSLLARFERSDSSIDYVGLRGLLGCGSDLVMDDCRADVRYIRTGTNGVRLVVLSDGYESIWQYLVFQLEPKGMWRFAGNIDFPSENFEEPVYRMEGIGGRRWLVFGHVDSWGTGFRLRKEVWFPLDEKIGKPQLDYLLDARICKENDKYVYDYDLESVKLEETNKMPMVILSHTKTKKLRSDLRSISQTSLQTRFVWSNTKHRFETVAPIADTMIIPRLAK